MTLKVLIILTAVWALLCGVDATEKMRWGASAIVVLGSAVTDRACLGVQLSDRFVLTMASCTVEKATLVRAFPVSPNMWAKNSTTSDEKFLLELSKPIEILRIQLYSKYGQRKTDSVKDRLPTDIAVAELRANIPQGGGRAMLLPGPMFPRPRLSSNYTYDAIVTVDPNTLTVWVTPHVVYVDNAQCGFPALNYIKAELVPLCVLPLIGHTTPTGIRLQLETSSKYWSFLVRRLQDEQQHHRDWIVGFGDTRQHFRSLFRGYSLIDAVVSEWLTAKNFPGVQELKIGTGGRGDKYVF